MSAVVKLGSKMPGNFETNGLDNIVEDLIDNPKTARLAVVVFDVERITVDTDTAEQIPTIRVRRFEPAGEAGDAFETLKRQFLALSESRLGKDPLPFDVVEVVEEAHLEGGPDNVVLGGFGDD